jgi:hypothetical protein
MDWDNGIVRPIAFDRLGQKYRRYRLADPPAEDAMARVLANCMDMSSVDLPGKHHSGYLPRDLGICGDDVHFVYCLDWGQIQGKFPLPLTGIEQGRV